MKYIPSSRSKASPTLSTLVGAKLIIVAVSLLMVTLTVVVSASNASVQTHQSVIASRGYDVPPDSQSTTGPIPPANVNLTGLAVVATSGVTVTIPSVPVYQWHHGCGPTAAGMIIGYWDGHGFDDLVPGDAGTQTAAVNEMIASEGPASNYTDYCEPIDYYPDLFPDLSEDPPGDEHPDECVADYMKTSQSYYYNRYGWSWFSHVGTALESYSRQALASGDYYVRTKNLYMQWDSSLNWDSLRSEINAGRPLVLLVDTDGNGITDHFVTAVGYGIMNGVRYYACLNTWDNDIHWYEFAPMRQGQAWGLFGGITFQILKLDIHTFLPLVIRN